MNAKDYMLQRISERLAQRNWNALPADFTRDAVKALYRELKPHFDKRDIRARIEAGRANTFTHLQHAVNLMLWR